MAPLLVLLAAWLCLGRWYCFSSLLNRVAVSCCKDSFLLIPVAAGGLVSAGLLAVRAVCHASVSVMIYVS